MTPDIEELLREGMRRRATDLVVPERVLGDAARRHRRRRNGSRVLVATGASATCAAVALVTTGGPTTGGPTTQPATTQQPTRPVTSPRIQTVASVVARSKAAIDSSNAIVHVHNPDVMDARDIDVWFDTRAQRILFETLNSAGRRVDAKLLPLNGGMTKCVDDTSRSWWLVERPIQIPEPGIDVRSEVRRFLDSKPEMLGHERIAGRDTMHLRQTYDAAGRRDSVDVWLDARSYLPVRISSRAEASGTIQARNSVSYYTWLPRTPANRARMALTTPNGYTRLPDLPFGAPSRGNC